MTAVTGNGTDTIGSKTAIDGETSSVGGGGSDRPPLARQDTVCSSQQGSPIRNEDLAATDM
ncbi:unnamed protein product, partial [Callosobruchus maculatus]